MARYVCWVKKDGVDFPQGERPRFYSRLDMISQRCKFTKMLKRRATTSCGENPKNSWPTNVKHTGVSKVYWRYIQWFKSLG